MLNNGNGFCTICQSEIVDYEIPSSCTGECGCGVEIIPDYAIPAEVELDFNKDHIVPIPQPVDYDLDWYEDNPLDKELEEMWDEWDTYEYPDEVDPYFLDNEFYDDDSE